jgi:putative acetyltransferase
MGLRRATTSDRDSIVALIDGILADYGEHLLLDGPDGDLADIEGHYDARGGAFVLLEHQGETVGTHGVAPLDRERKSCCFRRLYLDERLRGRGHGDELMNWTIEFAREASFSRVEFWSDVRFERAHRFFARFGFRRNGRTRDIEDGVAPYRECGFFLDL